ncbi:MULTISPECIES: stage III sporulation protein AG [Bacillus]|uniref:Stage III sporulation protein AG n=2 Tax=Bacillus TaxID=1386 RepID=A0A0M5JLN3_9BACI|nr:MULTISPECIES: stage III sporulation protein AG [Bacillus]ALC81577.1 stage III sporulation protein AG [Bacillus gobiensis]MBP1080615.1 stage III sporulation protein AG [Bacillus capparidis]MED1094471.1 stage III sporulation protein AG [Bacillus capparidis]
MDKPNWSERIKHLFFPNRTKNEEKAKLTKYHYLLIAFILGISFMLMNQMFSSPEGSQQEASSMLPSASSDTKPAEKEVFKPDKGNETNQTIEDYEQEYENEMKEILETVIGVEDVSIMVNVDATSLKVYEKNKKNQTQTTEETDKEGGKRVVTDQSADEQIVMIKKGDEEIPVVVQTKKPEIRGVLVVAQGVDNVQIKKTVIDAVTRVLDVPSHRVQVAPKKMKEDS